MEKVLLNRAKCANCGDVLTSEHGWDFKVCTCNTKWSNKLYKLWDDLKQEGLDSTECYADSRYKELHAQCRGIMVDGGLNYIKRGAFKWDDIIELSEYEEEQS